MKAAALLLFALLLVSCQQPERVASAQLPGLSTGAGATFTGPTNSAAPSSQVAKRTLVYQPAYPNYFANWQPNTSLGSPAPAPAADSAPSGSHTPPPVVPPIQAPVAWVQESVQTNLGEHQDASGIVAAAKKVEGWNRFEWIGLVLLLGGIAYILWSSKNPDGYPLVGWKVAGCGLLLLLTGGNPWMLSLLVIAVVFWAAQHTGLLKFPGL